MNNIILIDTDSTVLHELMNRTDIKIEVLISNVEDKKKLYKNYPNRIKQVFSVRELEQRKTTNLASLECDVIEEARGIQEKIETQLRRFMSDMNLIKLMYYEGLAFWTNIFQSCKIDGVICTRTNHGLLYDGIPLYYAVLKKLPAYCFEPIGYGWWYIYSETEQRFVLRYSGKEIESITEILKEKEGTHDVFHIDWNGHCESKIVLFVSRFFGYHTVDLLRAILKDHSLKKQKFICDVSFTSNYLDRKKSFRYIKRLERKLSTLEEEADFTEKYIYLPLNFEPEGRNLNYTIDSQIVLVKKIAEALPKGWKIFVKEHPHQYMLDNPLNYYFMSYIGNFKTLDFFKAIKSIPNVKLIKRSVLAEKLILHSQGVANRGGTVLIEALQHNKPIIVCDRNHVLAGYSGVLHGFESDGINRSIEQINRGYEPDYTEVLGYFNKYLIDGREKITENVVGLVSSDKLQFS